MALADDEPGMALADNEPVMYIRRQVRDIGEASVAQS
jgi:hypothetical protein